MSAQATERRSGFFRSRWVEPPAGTDELDPATLAPGFEAAGVGCGIKQGGEPDLGIVRCNGEEVASAALLTANAAAAAPVRLCRERCDTGALRAVIANSGNANAATGAAGYEHAARMQEAAADACELPPGRVGVASTGVVGAPLPIELVERGARQAGEGLSGSGGRSFAEAIMTTDRWPKVCSVRCGGVTLSAQAKGAGMMQPDFATLLCFVQTDAVVAQPPEALRAAAEASFARITVDGQLSTNDACFLQASGSSGRELPQGLLESVLLQLALEVVRDGEGATRVAKVRVGEALSAAEAEAVARAVANSQLVQTAIFGHDPNWGRVVQAAGMALAGEDLDLGEEDVEASELGTDGDEIELGISLGRGEAESHVYCSDLGYDYVKLNAEYTT